MSVLIECKSQSLWVSNQRVSSLLAFAIEVGEAQARSDEERRWCGELRFWSAQVWPSLGFDLDERFPGSEQKKFWARIYCDVARGIFLRQIGNHEVTFWQSSAIGDAYAIARMLMQSVQQTENGLAPEHRE